MHFVPTTPPVVPRVLQFENELPLTCTRYYLTENELARKLFARRDTEVNGMALYASMWQGNMPSSAQTPKN